MNQNQQTCYTAFEGHRRIASGGLRKVALETKRVIDRGDHGPVLILENTSSRTVEVDFRGTAGDVLARIADGKDQAAEAAPEALKEMRGPGRPKLGVVAREVTLLPRHWEWLNSQPNGASAALRRLVEEARRTNRAKDLARQSQEAVNRFMSLMTGDLPGYEEASRAFYRGDRQRLDQLTKPWPNGVREHLDKLVDTAMSDEELAAKE